MPTPDAKKAVYLQRLSDWAGARNLELPALASVETRSKSEHNLVLMWLMEDVPDNVAQLADSQIDSAFEIGTTVYRSFNDDFNRIFYDSGGAIGLRWTRQQLLRHTRIRRDTVVEAIVERIRGKWDHLWKHFSRKYQPSLWLPLTVEPNKVPGYLRNVVITESRKLKRDEIAGHVSVDDWQAYSTQDDADLSTHEGRTSIQELVEHVVEFWSNPDQGFTEDERLEGLVSLGLGWHTGSREIEARLTEYFEDQLQRLNELHDRELQLLAEINHLLTKRNRIHLNLQAAARADDRVEQQTLSAVARAIERKLIRARDRYDQLQSLRLPRPKDVQKILGDLAGQQGGIRFRRISREVDILKQRVLDAAGDVAILTRANDSDPETDSFSKALAALPARIQQHNEHPAPRSSRGRRSKTDAPVPTVDREHWEQAGWRILARANRLLRVLAKRRLPGDELMLQTYLEDVENLYRFGLLERKGVTKAIRLLNRGRIIRLLRVTRPGSR